MNEQHELQVEDWAELNEDAILDNKHFIDLSNRNTERLIKLGDKVRIIDMPFYWLLCVRFSNGDEALLERYMLDFLERPTPNDTTRYECDLFAWAGVQV